MQGCWSSPVLHQFRSIFTQNAVFKRLTRFVTFYTCLRALSHRGPANSLGWEKIVKSTEACSEVKRHFKTPMLTEDRRLPGLNFVRFQERLSDTVWTLHDIGFRQRDPSLSRSLLLPWVCPMKCQVAIHLRVWGSSWPVRQDWWAAAHTSLNDCGRHSWWRIQDFVSVCSHSLAFPFLWAFSEVLRGKDRTGALEVAFSLSGHLELPFTKYGFSSRSDSEISLLQAIYSFASRPPLLKLRAQQGNLGLI